VGKRLSGAQVMGTSTSAAAVPLNDASAPLLLFEHPASAGYVLAEARLSSEATLNALSLPMIDILTPALRRWAADERVVAVLVTGSGERAFSAGGDIQALYHAMVRNHRAGEHVDDYPDRFFEREYRLDFLLHTFRKPVVSLGHGIVMGGGLGVFSGARFRVVTGQSRIAMPEISIGLFPDAGATVLLGRLPVHVATFLAMTGSHINAADALAIGLGTHAVAAAERHRVAERLLGAPWTGRAAADCEVAAGALSDLPGAGLPALQIDAVPDELHPDGSAAEVAARIQALAGRDNWIDRGLATLRRGCPASLGIVTEQLRRAPGLSLADCFRLEMVVATHCARRSDFAEGIRALIIDKDNAPRWQHGSPQDLPADYVAGHFVSPWPQNPLHDLEVTAT
jgi:enoyl-CoA hydratase/carnithine racemase